jgi:fibronectin type 3 domain-containing protein
VYRYRIYRSEESGAQQYWNPLVSTIETNYIDQTVVHGKTYFYVVRASDRAGNEEKNALQVAATSVDTTPPRPPRGLKAEETDIGARIKLVWLAPGGEVPAEYWIFRSGSHGTQNFSSPLAVVSKTQFTDRTVQDGVVYYYVVRAVDIAGNVETNTNEIAVVSRDITPPPAALDVGALPQRGGVIGVGWMPPGSDVEDVDLAKQIRADVDHYQHDVARGNDDDHDEHDDHDDGCDHLLDLALDDHDSRRVGHRGGLDPG